MEQNYLNTMQDVLDQGTWQKNERTGELCCTLDGAMTRFDISQAFTCAVTTKKLAFKSITAEFVGFMRGYRSAAYFRELGSKVWDANANENEAWLNNPFRQGPDDLGDIYGVQWRRWPAYKLLELGEQNGPKAAKLINDGWTLVGYLDPSDGWGARGVLYYKAIDQLAECIRKIILTPSDRRILFHGWNPAKLDEVALPACHILYQFLPNLATRELNLAMYQRSNDAFLGLPFNFAECGLLLSLVGRLTGFTPKRITHFAGDIHIYEKHLSAVQEQLKREPYPAPKLVIDERIPTYAQICDELGSQSSEPWYEDSLSKAAIGWLNHVKPEDFQLEGYEHHPELKAPMAI